MTQPVIISVVRDFAMYERCLGVNPNCRGCQLIPLDNRAQNEGLPKRYNAFLASRPSSEEAWYIFCHEDFEPREPLLPRLANLDPNAIWGVIGAVTRVRLGFYHQWLLLGQITECNKDGSNEHLLGEKVALGTPVETFDCQCLIVHSSLIRRFDLSFDEHLTFDLYVEDFCMAAAAKGVAARILPLACRHWSNGKTQPRYYVQEAYLAKKYPNACFTGIISCMLGGKVLWGRRLTVFLRRYVRDSILKVVHALFK